MYHWVVLSVKILNCPLSFTFYIDILQENSKGKRMKNFFCKNYFLRVIYDLKLITLFFWQACFNGCYSGPAREGPSYFIIQKHYFILFHFIFINKKHSQLISKPSWFWNCLYYISLIFMLGILLDNFSNFSWEWDESVPWLVKKCPKIGNSRSQQEFVDPWENFAKTNLMLLSL